MKVAYLFITPRSASYKLGQMILPQLEGNIHSVEVVGMFFFDDNVFVLRKGDPIGERLAKIAKEKNILLMMCDSCALERGLAKGKNKWVDEKFNPCPNPCEIEPYQTVEGVKVGCFPDLYQELAKNPPDQVISL